MNDSNDLTADVEYMYACTAVPSPTTVQNDPKTEPNFRESRHIVSRDT